MSRWIDIGGNSSGSRSSNTARSDNTKEIKKKELEAKIYRLISFGWKRQVIHHYLADMGYPVTFDLVLRLIRKYRKQEKFQKANLLDLSDMPDSNEYRVLEPEKNQNPDETRLT